MGPNVFFIFTSCCYLCLTVSVKAIVRIDSPLCDQPDTFHCNDTKKECIPMSLVCNGISECSTGRDESVEECGCNKWEYQCNDSVCIDLIRRCDNVKDCDDGNDEQSCELYQCPSTHSKCKNHMCIPRDKSCDFIDDCGDNSDEETCDYPECYDTQFKCNNSQCISKGMLCDKVPDCLDGSDEANCDSYFQCSDHLRLVNSTVCDGWVDCDGDQKDEINCGECSKSEFSCNNGRCIKLSNVCDGVCDCGGTCDDEDECGSVDCPVGDGYICRNEVNKQLRCIDKKYLCDGNNDCLNTNVGADEYFCWNISQQCADFPRHYKKFVCPEGRCLPASGPENVVCDHWYDCLNGEDEHNCDYATCSPLEHQCGNGQCIKENQRCNGVFDCADRTDETHCENWKCPTGYYKCRGGQCIPGHHRCDYYRDCPDGTDEKNCENHENRRKCLPNEFKCDNGQCIDRDMICYKGKNVGRRGCADGSHMHNCSGWNCTVGQYKCRMSYCIDMEQLCDSLVDCSNTYEDELGCPYVCPYKANTCLCEESKLNCTRRALTDLPDYLEYESGLTDFILTGNYLNVSLTSGTFRTYDRLVHLDLSNNSIVTLPSGSFHSLWRLTSLSLEKNKIKVLKNGTFIGLMNLRSLYLAHNAIEKIEAFAFTGLSKLQTLDLSFHNLRILQRSTFVGLRNLFTLDLSHNQIRYIADGSFNGLPVLLTLDLSENQIEIIEPNTFHGLQTLRTLYTDEFHFCCLIDSVAKCYPEPDEFSSCEDLMSNYFLRASIWILGIIAFFGNILVFAWRVRDFRKGKVHSFLISNLAIADFFMGVYLLIIASVDSYYRGNYFIYDKLWKESSFCKFAGCISTFSSELSVFTLTVITFDRLICIIFPLKLKRLGIKQACIVMPLVWIVVLGISTIPLLEMSYFSNFYGRSGVCLALHITPEKPKGWEYSVFVFLVLNFVSFLLIFLSYLWMFLVAKKTTTAVRKSKAKSDKSMAKRMTLIVMTDFCCWIPIILLGFISLGGFSVPQQVYAWVAVFVLPLNSAINPVLYTISTAPFMRNIRKRASRFRKSFTGSFRSSFTKHSYIDERTSETWNRHSMYRQLELMRLRGLKKTYSYSTHRTPEKLSRM